MCNLFPVGDKSGDVNNVGGEDAATGKIEDPQKALLSIHTETKAEVTQNKNTGKS